MQYLCVTPHSLFVFVFSTAPEEGKGWSLCSCEEASNLVAAAKSFQKTVLLCQDTLFHWT